jgi:hypothetical protein
MVIDNFNIKNITVQPAKTNTPLIVDANAVLSRSVTRQGFKSIARRTTQKRKSRCCL